jgi:hypothetical protein
MTTITGSSLTRTSAWHPASNGMIERLYRQLKAALMYHCDEHWTDALPLVLLGIRSEWKDLNASSAELVYGSPCGYRGNSSSLPPPNAPTSPISRPCQGSTSQSFGPYQPPGMPRDPYSFSKTWSPPRMSFYGKALFGQPFKPLRQPIQDPPQER